MADMKKVILEFDDDSTKEITNGFIVEFDGDEMCLTTTGFSKLDIMRMVYGILASVEQLGMTEDFERYMEHVNGGKESEEG